MRTASAAAGAPTIRLAACRMPSRWARWMPALTEGVSPKSSAEKVTILAGMAAALIRRHYGAPTDWKRIGLVRSRRSRRLQHRRDQDVGPSAVAGIGENDP